jgi:hypothetical protein
VIRVDKGKAYGALVALSPVAFVAAAILVRLLGLDPETPIRELMRLVDRGLFYERWGREIASKTEEEDVVDEDVDYLDHLLKLYRDMDVTLRELADMCEHAWCQTLAVQTQDRVNYIRDELRVIRNALNQVRWRARRRDRLSAHVPHYSDWRAGIVGYGLVAKCVSGFGNLVKELTNRECVWVLNKLKGIEEYTFAELVNDVTACHHTLMDFLRFHLDPELQEVFPKVFSKYGSPELVELCKDWVWSTNALYRGGDGIYFSDDYYGLRCVVWGNRAELRVGSAVGHATHAELYGGTVVVRYYDTDEEVHTGLTLVADRFGFRPAKHTEEEYTEFRVPLDRARDFFTYVLPCVTSMDLRLENPDLYWGAWMFRTAREFEETYGGLVKERGPLGAEVELYLTALRRVGLLRG